VRLWTWGGEWVIYVAEALLLYVGAVLMARGTYTYLQMSKVLKLIVFTVLIGSQLMAFSAYSVYDSGCFTDIFSYSPTNRGQLKLDTILMSPGAFCKPSSRVLSSFAISYIFSITQPLHPRIPISITS
jgi:hypothetical protein